MTYRGDQTAHESGCPALSGYVACTCAKPKTEMTSLLEIKQRLAAIEQGQGVLCERLDKLIGEINATDTAPGISWRIEEINQKLNHLLAKQAKRRKK